MVIEPVTKTFSTYILKLVEHVKETKKEGSIRV